MEQPRCGWVPDEDELYARYHDTEWGVPVRSDAKLFEMLILETAQAGLSWRTILGRREGYRACFADFDPRAVARFSEEDTERLRHDSRIIRNRAKIASAVNNARRFLAVQEEHGSFSAYLWGFVDNEPIINRFASLAEVPAETDLSRTISRDMKARGFTFVGPVCVYALMQSVGLVMDHVTSCFRFRELSR